MINTTNYLPIIMLSAKTNAVITNNNKKFANSVLLNRNVTTKFSRENQCSKIIKWFLYQMWR